MIYLGTWNPLVETFGEGILAGMLECSLETLQAMACNAIPVPPGSSEYLSDLMMFHGIKPMLYTHPWKNNHGILIASIPGWLAWTLQHGFSHKTRFIGNPDLLIPANDELISLACNAGWRKQ